MLRDARITIAVIPVVALVGCLLVLRHMPGTRLPQAQAGDDILSVVLGDAKKDLSGAMLHEADSYFHGGVDIDCNLHEEGHDHHDHEHDLEHHEHNGDLGRDGARPSQEQGFDPWRWINAHVRAPEIERHLAEDKIIEMMPWFWVAVKADPHNIEAWTAAWYSAARLMKNPQMALKIAEEGVRENPESIELHCTIGRTYHLQGFVDDVKAEAAFERARRLGLSQCGGNPSDLSENDQGTFLQALDFLSYYAAGRKDKARMRALLEEARRTRPGNVAIADIEKRLRRVQ